MQNMRKRVMKITAKYIKKLDEVSCTLLSQKLVQSRGKIIQALARINACSDYRNRNDMSI